MKALLIICGIIAFIVILLYFPLNAVIRYVDGNFTFEVKYLGMKFYPKKNKKSKKRISNKKKADIKEISEKDGKDSSPEITAEDKPEIIDGPGFEGVDITYVKNPPKKEKADAPEKKGISAKLEELKGRLELIKLLWELCGKNVKKILRDIRADDVVIDVTAAADNACDAALLYGKIHAVIWNVIASLSEIMTFRIKTVDIVCDFDRKKAVYNAGARINIRPAVLIGNLLAAGAKLLANYGRIKPYLDDDKSGSGDKIQTSKKSKAKITA